jgi:MFS transporter, DHA1 family, multidrug resistance protein
VILNKSKYIFCFLFFYLAAGRLSIDIVAPVLSAFSTPLHANFSQAKLLISFYILGIGFGQIPTGFCIDRINVKVIIISGLTLYIIGNLLCFFSSNLDFLLFARFLAGLGASVGSVVYKYVMQNLYEGDAKGFARAWSMLSVSLIVSMISGPLIGLLIYKISTAHMIFVFGALYGVLLLLIFTTIQKYLVLKPSSSKIISHQLGKTTMKQLVCFTAIAAMGIASLVLAMQNYPHIVELRGLEPHVSAMLIMTMAVGYLSSSLLLSKLLTKITQLSLLKLTCLAFLLPALCLWLYMLTHVMAILLISAFLVGTIGRLVIPNAVALALANLKTNKNGILLALVGTVQMIVAGLFSYVDTLIDHHPLIVFPVELAVIGGVSIVLIKVLLRKNELVCH